MPAAACVNLVVRSNPETASRYAADRICRALRARPSLLLCAAAGGSPAGTYRELARHARREPGLFRHLRVIQVDEWLGLDPGDPATCAADLQDKLVGPLGLSRDRFCALRTDAANPARECRRVAAWLARHGPIDLAVLGVGRNGHLAMNEPAAALTPGVHVARLAPATRRHALLRACARKPTRGITLGMSDLVASREILLLALGPQKRPLVRRLRQPAVSTRFPASLLQLHPHTTVVCDRAAAGRRTGASA
jgi:galactosamine-6-phosphate isomerase